MKTVRYCDLEEVLARVWRRIHRRERNSGRHIVLKLPNTTIKATSEKTNASKLDSLKPETMELAEISTVL
jgi:hypothetical protein